MQITPDTLSRIALRGADANMTAAVRGLMRYPAGLDLPHRLIHFLGQTCHESEGWRFDHEIWGPTAAQTGYEGRLDLGNTHQGDGFKFRGRGAIQITGGANYRAFMVWARGIDPMAPDFTLAPDMVLSDPWEGLAPIWYWQSRDINAAADRGDVVEVTHRINGGTNGLAMRMQHTAQAAAVLYGVRSVREFQTAHALTPDGVAGPLTLGVAQHVMAAMPPITFSL